MPGLGSKRRNRSSTGVAAQAETLPSAEKLSAWGEEYTPGLSFSAGHAGGTRASLRKKDEVG